MSFSDNDKVRFKNPDAHPNIRQLVDDYGPGPYRIISATEEYALVEYSPGHENVVHVSYLEPFPENELLTKRSAVDKKAAYEKNKVRDVCILCGKRTITRSLFTGTIQYCACVE